jgi:hypothetical protein
MVLLWYCPVSLGEEYNEAKVGADEPLACPAAAALNRWRHRWRMIKPCPDLAAKGELLRWGKQWAPASLIVPPGHGLGGVG